jgi:hypothetical protein
MKRAAVTGKSYYGSWAWLLSFGLLACDAFTSERLASEQRSGKAQELAGRVRRLEKIFDIMLQGSKPAALVACSESEIRKTVAASDNRRVPFVDAPSLERFAAGKSLDPAEPLARFVSEVLVRRRASGQITDEKTATDAAFDAASLQKQHDYLAVLSYQLTRPKADPKGFHGGELEGRLGLFDLSNGKLMCATPVVAHSHEQVERKPGQSPQDAAVKDFEAQTRRALEEAFSGLTREVNLDLR